MLPVALLVLVFAGVLAVVVGTLFSKMERLGSRVEQLERRHEDLLNLVSDAILDHDQKQTLELKLRNLLSDR